MTTGSEEIELKFTLTAEAAFALRRELFDDVEAEPLVSIYYDTPELALRQDWTTLRLRTKRRGWLQTVKAGGAGAIARYEDERPVDAPVIEAALLQNGPLAEVDVQALHPVFATHIDRRTAVVRAGESEVELALDEGEVRAGDAQAAVLELELELKSGVMPDLFVEAGRLTARPGVMLSLTSKAERGYALAAGTSDVAVHFQRPRLDFAGPAADAFQALALACLHQLTANVELLTRRADPEAVHQARIALRRLRAMVGAFRAMVADDVSPQVEASLKRMADLFADARSLDVFAAGTFQLHGGRELGAAKFAAALQAGQRRAAAKIVRDIIAPAFAADLLAATRWTLCGPWTLDPARRSMRDRSLSETAATLLRHRRKVMLKHGRKLDWNEPVARHKLRIQAKKMRYLLDSFRPDAPARLLKPLKRLQAELGELNDIHTAPDTAAMILPDVDAAAGFAAGATVGQRCAEIEERVRRAKTAFTHFADAKPPWG